MIKDSNPEMGILCHIGDMVGGRLTVQPAPSPVPNTEFAAMLGLVVSDADNDTAGILLTADDRRALAAALLDGLDP